MNRLARYATLVSMVAGVALTFWGLWHQPWPQTLPWNGTSALLRYITYIILCVGLVFLLSKKLRCNYLVAGCVVGMGLTLLAGAFWPLLVTVWFFCAALLLGEKLLVLSNVAEAGQFPVFSFLTGAGVYATCVSIIAHFPVNYPAVYAFALILPFFINRQGMAVLVSNIRQWTFCQEKDRSTRYIEMGLAVVSLSYGVFTLMPELGFDPLVMHLFVPSQLLSQHKWGFDVSTYAFAVMPMFGDWIYSIGYILGGETAARLINLGFILVIAVLTHQLAIWASGTVRAGQLAALLFMSTPLSFSVGTSLYVEPIWTSYLLACLLAVLRTAVTSEATKNTWVVGGILLGCAVATKSVAFLMLPILGAIMLWKWRSWMNRDMCMPVCFGLLAFLLIGSLPYVNAWLLTGNPVFPFFNKVFQSPYFPATNFRDVRWAQGMTWDILYAVIFHANLYQEARVGAPGFQWLLVFIPAFFILVGGKKFRALFMMALAGLFMLLVFLYIATYLRYIFPSMILFTVAIGVAFGQDTTGDFYKVFMQGVLVLLVFLNLMYLNAASWWNGEVSLGSVFDGRARVAHQMQYAPVRIAVESVNKLNVNGNPVAFFSSPYGAGLEAQALYANWYNYKFRDAAYQVQSNDEAFELLQEKSVNFIILDKAGDEPGFDIQRRYFDNITNEIVSYGSISIRKINPAFQFRHQILMNPDFKSQEGWQFLPGAHFDPANNSVLVNVSAPVVQAVAVKAGRQYRNTVIAKCVDKPATGRLQVNWLDDAGKFITTNIVPFECTSDWNEYTMTVTAPLGAKTGHIYTSGHTEKFVTYKYNEMSY